MPRIDLKLAVLTSALVACATTKPAKIAPPKLTPVPGTVIFDVDLTKGDASPGEVTGGKFDKGWRVTSKEGQRIVFDAGHPIANGFLLVSFTMKNPPHGPKAEKIDWVGMHEDPGLSQETSSGDIFLARVGQAKYNFSEMKAAGRKFDKSEWDKAIGKTKDWVTDDHTVMTVKLQWRNGQAIFFDPHGKMHVCPPAICGGATPVDKLRYAFIGSDKYTNVSLQGIRYLRVKLVEEKVGDNAGDKAVKDDDEEAEAKGAKGTDKSEAKDDDDVVKKSDDAKDDAKAATKTTEGTGTKTDDEAAAKDDSSDVRPKKKSKKKAH